MFHDKPGVMYENPPPPIGFEFDDEPIFFSYPRPQRVILNPEMRFIKIDRSLIHRSLLGYEEKETRQTCTESTRGDENRKGKLSKENSVKNGDLEITKTKSAISQKEEFALFPEKSKERKQKNRFNEEKNDIDFDDSRNSRKKKDMVNESSALESISKLYFMSESDSDINEKHRTKSSSRHAKSHSKKSSRHRKKDKDSSISMSELDSDNNENRTKSSSRHAKSHSKKSSRRRKKDKDSSISISELDSDNDENRTKSSSHHAKSHSKKSSRRRKKDKNSRNDTSHSDVIPYDEVGLRSVKISVKREINSSDEESFNSYFSKKAEITVKEEVLSDKDDYRKDKRKSSKSSKKKNDDSGSQDFLRNLDDSRCSDDTRNHEEESFRSSLSKKAEIAVKEEVFSDKVDYRKDKFKSSKKKTDHSRSHDDAIDPDDSRKNHSSYSSDDDSRNRRHDDSNSSSRNFNSYVKTEVKPEIKLEPGSTSCFAPSDLFCEVCKLLLNSESTYNSHMAGKKHKKALRQLSEQEVAKSSVSEIKESLNFPRPSDRDRIELYDEESKIQRTCEEADLLIVGLDFVQEIRGYEETKYFCDLCSAQCVANSIIKHLIGFKHQMNCLKEYCFKSYSRVKDIDKRNRRVDEEITFQLDRVTRLYGKGKIKVFRDIKRSQRSPEPYNPYQPSTSRQEPYDPYQPSTSRQTSFPEKVQGKKADEPKVTDEECLSRDFSDFYCKVCDSHMNNFSMWESHANGKKHARNKKKAEEEGSVSNSNVIDAPPGTICHLEEMIHDLCDPQDVIVGLNFIRENQGANGNLYNCFLCGSVCPSIDIVDHLYLKKHKAKYLEKMHSDGYENAIVKINGLSLGETAREGLINDECFRMMEELGRGRPVVVITKK